MSFEESDHTVHQSDNTRQEVSYLVAQSHAMLI